MVVVLFLLDFLAADLLAEYFLILQFHHNQILLQILLKKL
jgi:hypothetical protein